MKAKLVSRKEIAENTILTEFEPAEKVSFKAGQYMVLNLPNPTYTDGKGSTRIFSIASAPDDPLLGVATRLSESAFKRSLNEMEIGGEVEIKVIGGKFVLPDSSKKIVMIAGGIGITPFFSMARTAWKLSPDYDITVFYSNRTLKSTAFLDELREMAEKNQKFHLVLTMTREENWQGENKGRVDEEFVRKYVAEPEKAVFMIVGPPLMVKELSELLKGMGVPEGSVLSESFSR